MATNLSMRNDAFYVKMTIKGPKALTFEALIDTGADLTNLYDEECRKLELQLVGGKTVVCIHGDEQKLPLYDCIIELAGKSKKDVIVGLPKPIHQAGSQIIAIIGRASLGESRLNLDWIAKRGVIQ